MVLLADYFFSGRQRKGAMYDIILLKIKTFVAATKKYGTIIGRMIILL
jgi:hypothetical protein